MSGANITDGSERPLGILNRARALLRFAIRPAYRGIVLAQVTRPDEVHQTSLTTRLDRYPRIFEHIQRLHGREAPLRVLSFGCSTGEEVISLRSYFPRATIVGMDINRHNLRTARRRARQTGARFVLSTRRALEENGPYDAIFCMAVLQRTPEYVRDNDIQDISALYPFSKFEAQLVALDRSLRTGGLLVLKFAQYFLEDTVLAGQYEAVPGGPRERKDIIRFARSGVRKTSGADPVIFRKIR